MRTGTWRGFTKVSRMTGLTFNFTKPGNDDWIVIDVKFEEGEEPSATLTIDGITSSDMSDPVWKEGQYFEVSSVDLSNDYTWDNDYDGYDYSTSILGSLDTIEICTWSNICLASTMIRYMAWVTLPPIYSGGKPKGLCGNFNQIKTDDRRLRNGEVLLHNPRSNYDFASDWLVEGTCVAHCGRKRRTDDDSEDNDEDNEDNPWSVTCPESATYDPICENLFVANFWDECRAVLSPEQAIAICKLEYCLVPTSAVLMTIVDNYALNCKLHLPRDTKAFCTYETVEWYQSMNITPPPTAGFKLCAEDMTFTGCGFQSKDMRTCEQHMLNTPVSKTERSQSGCVCKTGFVRHNNECILSSTCPSPVGDGLGFDMDGDGVGDGLPELQEGTFSLLFS